MENDIDDLELLEAVQWLENLNSAPVLQDLVSPDMTMNWSDLPFLETDTAIPLSPTDLLNGETSEQLNAIPSEPSNFFLNWLDSSSDMPTCETLADVIPTENILETAAQMAGIIPDEPDIYDWTAGEPVEWTEQEWNELLKSMNEQQPTELTEQPLLTEQLPTEQPGCSHWSDEFPAQIEENEPPAKRRKLNHCRQCKISCDDEFCDEHANQKQCKRCGLRKKDEHFTSNDAMCNTCVKFKQQKGGSETALRGKVVTTRLPGYETSDLREYYRINRDEVTEVLKERLNVDNLKFSLGVGVRMERVVDDEVATTGASFKSTPQIVRDEHEIDDAIDAAVENLITKIDEYIKNGSGYVVIEIDGSRIDTARFSPIFGSSYIEMPKRLANTKGVVNVKNDDNKCFIW